MSSPAQVPDVIIVGSETRKARQRISCQYKQLVDLPKGECTANILYPMLYYKIETAWGHLKDLTNASPSHERILACIRKPSILRKVLISLLGIADCLKELTSLTFSAYRAVVFLNFPVF